MTQKPMTTFGTNNYKSYEGPSFEISDLENNLKYVNMLFNTVASKIQNSWNLNLKSRYVNLCQLNEADKDTLTNALPGIERLILEKFRVSWLNFKTRFQQQISKNNVEYKSFCNILVNIEKQLFSFDSLLSHTCESLNHDKFNGSENEEKLYTQFIENNSNDKAKRCRIMLPIR